MPDVWVLIRTRWEHSLVLGVFASADLLKEYLHKQDLAEAWNGQALETNGRCWTFIAEEYTYTIERCPVHGTVQALGSIDGSLSAWLKSMPKLLIGSHHS